MDIFFQDPSEIPLPPEEVRILEMRANPYPDGQRVRIYLEVTPFQKRPNAEIAILDPRGEEVAQVSVIESMSRKMEFTMHLRKPELGSTYTLAARLFYTAPLPPPPGPEEPAPRQPIQLPEPTFVDDRRVTFELPAAQDSRPASS
jgi:hypothetical protein